MIQNKLLNENRTDILRLAAQHGAHNVCVFGPMVCGETYPESCIDFLVEMEEGRSLFDLGSLQTDLQDLLGVNVDVVTVKGLRLRIKDRVLQEAAAL